MDIIRITDSGIATTNRDTIFNNLMQEFKTLYGDNTYIKEGTEDYNMLSLLADLLNDMGNVAVSAGNALSLTNAVGIQLDNLASVYYGTFSRKPATYSTVVLQITGTPNTNIVNGQVRDSYGGIWNLESPITIPVGGTTNVSATYTEPGAYYISANKISGAGAIATPISGWDNVAQPNECSVGQDVETDASFRARIAQRSKGTAIGTLNSLQSNLLAMEFEDTTPIQAVKIYENDTSNNATDIISGVTIPSHTIVPIVYTGGTVTVGSDLSKTIAHTIYDYKSSGVGTFGSVNQVITNSQGQSITVNFEPATNQTFEIAISLRKLIPTAPDLTDSAKEVIQNAVNTKLSEYGIGDTIYAQDFYYTVTSAISQVLDITQYNINTITLTSGGTTATSIALPYNKKAIIEDPSTDITITAV